jgi:uncharacterized protein (TIGR02246 family)
MNAIIPHLITALPLAALLGLGAANAGAAPHVDDARVVAELDTRFQEAVKHNDADTMAQIFHDDVILVVGSGKVFTRDDMLNEARSGAIAYERQDEEPGSQTVRVWGDTAVVTAKLWIKGVEDGKPFDRKVWFSDTYVRTDRGWRYFFGQSSTAPAN